jgi:hypothetical protein
MKNLNWMKIPDTKVGMEIYHNTIFHIILVFILYSYYIIIIIIHHN